MLCMKEKFRYKNRERKKKRRTDRLINRKTGRQIQRERKKESKKGRGVNKKAEEREKSGIIRWTDILTDTKVIRVRDAERT